MANEEKRGLKVRPSINLLLAVIALAAGGGIMMMLMKSPLEAEKVERLELVPRVEVVTVDVTDYQVRIATQGQVEPVTQTSILSEVGGMVESVSPKLKVGGRFDAGEVIVTIAQVDYLAALEQAKAQVADAELLVAQEKARAEQGVRDWKKLGRGGEPGPLVTREPQLKSAKARLAAAIAAVQLAERDLSKTRVIAPYDCLVESVHIDHGGYLNPSARVAELYAADRVQMRLPLSLEDVAMLPEPLTGVTAEVRAEIGSQRYVWKGEIVRHEGRIDRATNTLMTVVEVKADGNEGLFSLPPTGLFVHGSFLGKSFPRVMQIPRIALRGDDLVWVVNADDRLEMKTVEVIRSEHDYVVVKSGLAAGDRVITSAIDIAVPQMKLEVSSQGGHD